ncbi:hypothetical protein LINGRAHAP2_LOCUS26154 [Linum grandiflorum]
MAPPTTNVTVLLKSLIMIVTSTTMMMSAVNCYDDQTGYCAGPDNICRYSENNLLADVSQYDIYFTFYEHAFDSPAVCRRLYLPRDQNFQLYAYFTCNLQSCYNCYRQAFISMMNPDGCPGTDGAMISLDGCCLSQSDIYIKFYTYAFDSAAVCRRLVMSVEKDFTAYAYFSCNIEDCTRCYDTAFRHMMRDDGTGCPGKDCAFISLDGCCLRVKECKFCYQKAFKWLMEKDGSGCPGNAGAFISLNGDDGCCLRYEKNETFCGVRSDATKQNQNG